jgi:hypothetical protein
MGNHPGRDWFERLSLQVIGDEFLGKEFEGGFLDCKQKSDPARAGLNHDDKKNFAKELCAFSNTDGGLLIWGLSARTINGVDRVHEIVPIKGLDKFQSDLQTAHPQMTEPPVPGVEFKQIVVSGTGANKEGVIAVWIPPTDITLHRSTQDRQFYSRSGGSSWPMPMSIVTPLLTGKTRPRLDIHLDQISNRQGVICLRNTGHSTARDPFLALKLPEALEISGSELNGNDPLRSCARCSSYRGVGGKWVLYNDGAAHPIHPGAEIRIVELRVASSWTVGNTPMDIEYYVYADGAPEKHETINIIWR